MNLDRLIRELHGVGDDTLTGMGFEQAQAAMSYGLDHLAQASGMHFLDEIERPGRSEEQRGVLLIGVAITYLAAHANPDTFPAKARRSREKCAASVASAFQTGSALSPVGFVSVGLGFHQIYSHDEWDAAWGQAHRGIGLVLSAQPLTKALESAMDEIVSGVEARLADSPAEVDAGYLRRGVEHAALREIVGSALSGELVPQDDDRKQAKEADRVGFELWRLAALQWANYASDDPLPHSTLVAGIEGRFDG